jgi:hypothetical protein
MWLAQKEKLYYNTNATRRFNKFVFCNDRIDDKSTKDASEYLSD